MDLAWPSIVHYFGEKNLGPFALPSPSSQFTLLLVSPVKCDLNLLIHIFDSPPRIVETCLRVFAYYSLYQDILDVLHIQVKNLGLAKCKKKYSVAYLD